MENQQIIEAPNMIGELVNQVLYTGRVHVAGGREGYAMSDDGRLDTSLSAPGSLGKGTNPEQLFAAGWSACFIGAMQHNAANLQIDMPKDAAIDAEVDLALGDDGFILQARLDVILPGLTQSQASALVAIAHQTCPYSKATRGNINVQISVSV